MRKSIISSTVVVALAIPSAAGAQTVDPGGYSVVQKPAWKAVRKVPIKKVRKAKAGAPKEAAENPDGSRRSAKSSPSPPCALSQQSSEIARRCLRLSGPGERSPTAERGSGIAVGEAGGRRPVCEHVADLARRRQQSNYRCARAGGREPLRRPG